MQEKAQDHEREQEKERETESKNERGSESECGSERGGLIYGRSSCMPLGNESKTV